MGQCSSCYAPRGLDAVLDASDTEDSDTDDKESAERELFDEFNELNRIGELSPYNLTEFILTLYLQKLPDDLKRVCMKYLGDDDDDLNLDLQYPFNSTILTTTEKYSLLAILQRHLRNRSITLKLIYRASSDGYTAKAFHEKCDKYNYTVHIIEPLSNTQTTKLPVFGAFTSIKISNLEKEHRDEKMVLFRVRADYRSSKLVTPNIYHSENSFQYHWKNYVKTHTHSMIGFGTKGEENTYLHIDDKCNYRCNYVKDDGLTKWMAHTIGYSNDKQKLYFRVKEMEVFQVEQLFVIR